MRLSLMALLASLLLLGTAATGWAQAPEEPPAGDETEQEALEPAEEGQAEPGEPPAEGDELVGAEEAAAAEEEPLLPPLYVLPEPVEVEVIEVSNDDGTSVGVLWRWSGAPTETTRVRIEVEIQDAWLDDYRLNEREQERLDAARDRVRTAVEPVIPELLQARAEEAAATETHQLANNNRDPETLSLLRERWAKTNQTAFWQRRLDRARDNYISRAGELDERAKHFDYLSATLAQGNWLVTDVGASGDVGAPSFRTKAEAPNRFGHDPEEGDKLYVEVSSFTISHPDVVAGTFQEGYDELGEEPTKTMTVNFLPGRLYNLRMVVSDNGVEEAYELGGATPRVNFFNASFLNNLILTVLFACIILTGIMLARRNPNLFIRRISGLEAVDDAIGRATEMGKPVLYLCGLDSLATLSTLAAVNILGRVARRIADYDSDLVVPCRDPVVLTVAQEVVREGYIDQGRPDAYKEDKIFFVTDDQFSYTATTCAIMMRDRPAANFFMGYYYAESLLLAETGASTGAIQIAGTDATHQLPFFITTCDYTLIGEELYAASAYLSREPMLLGSLKGQDVGKALIMLIIIVQTLLFAVHAILAHYNPAYLQQSWDWLRILLEPL